MFDENGNNHWAKIADKMNNKKAKCNHRTGKQCRDRWNNHLRANIKKGEWTKEEEHLIREMHKAFGTKYVEIYGKFRNLMVYPCAINEANMVISFYLYTWLLQVDLHGKINEK